VTAFIGVVLFIVGALMLYALVIRPWMKKQAWAQAWFAWVEPIELAVFKKSETVLAGRLVWLSGFVVAAYDAIAAFATQLDLTPLQTRIFDALHIPPDMRALATSATIMGIGLAMVKLRKTTTRPLELVAVPDASVTPKLAQALDVAEVTKNDAVAAVTEAKAV
jgi:hypothetical protein